MKNQNILKTMHNFLDYVEGLQKENKLLRSELHCAEMRLNKQTRRAYALGAPIESKTKAGYYCNKEYPIQLNVFQYGKVPTTQQMIGWLREKGLLFEFTDIPNACDVNVARYDFATIYSNDIELTPHQAELAAIDAALDYLEKGGEK